MPDKRLLEQLEDYKFDENGNVVPKEETPQKRGRGRPNGSKDSKPRKSREQHEEWQEQIDPATGLVVQTGRVNDLIVRRMGDEKVSSFVAYHLQMMQMRQGCDKKNVPDLYNRFVNYLAYCAEHGIIPNNMNAYYAIGINREDIRGWKMGERGTPEHRKFAEEVSSFFASVHEQAPVHGLMNPISAMFWQKAHDGMIEASKLEVVNTDPLGEKTSAEDIVERYKDIVLPE